MSHSVGYKGGNLYQLFGRIVASRADAPCLIAADETVTTYDDLSVLAGRMAGEMVRRGVQPGDRVMVQAPKSAEMLALYLATIKAGGIFVPLNEAYKVAEVELFRDDARSTLMIQDPVSFASEAASTPPLEEAVERDAADIAALIYTSGTTGRSKGAMLSHGALAHNALALVSAWAFTPSDVLLHALPIFHAHGLFISSHTALFSGCAMIWLPRFSEDAVIATLPRATVMMGVPTFYTRLLDDPRFTPELVADIRLFVSGSAPLREATFAEFEARTGQRLLERYGMSEAMVITANPLQGSRLAGSVGYPLDGIAVRIAGGATGEIEIKGDSLFSGYWGLPEKTAEEFTADGWFKTGDIGHQDADGRLWISGRAKDLIITGGYNVYPKEIELVLDDLPGVSESAVIGVPHPDFGEAVVAVAVTDGDPDSLVATVRQRLAGFKVPKRVIAVDALPRNAMGKVQKAELRDRFAHLFEKR